MFDLQQDVNYCQQHLERIAEDINQTHKYNHRDTMFCETDSKLIWKLLNDIWVNYFIIFFFLTFSQHVPSITLTNNVLNI